MVDEPYFDCAIETGGHEDVGVFRIIGKIHNIMCDLRMSDFLSFHKI